MLVRLAYLAVTNTFSFISAMLAVLSRLLGGVATGQQRQPADNPAEHHIDETQRHEPRACPIPATGSDNGAETSPQPTTMKRSIDTLQAGEQRRGHGWAHLADDPSGRPSHGFREQVEVADSATAGHIRADPVVLGA
ncbi:hypothetical protein Aple_103930 [Acrocarpospora pleiomorpha]|uniref:Uncharacterized protein n=1 Tax=Acrocarpospora pleiomorpha TaxID=90975 RepID=A0A5M3Y5B8_9ACTN|nr:hypothetical protein Aple_103930 [Acrocarpospora pleiomorpha]